MKRAFILNEHQAAIATVTLNQNRETSHLTTHSGRHNLHRCTSPKYIVGRKCTYGLRHSAPCHNEGTLSLPEYSYEHVNTITQVWDIEKGAYM